MINLKSNGFLKDLKVLSVEQAAALPYCTWRLAVDGADVIRVEPLWGDPNRNVGKKVIEEEGMNAYFMSVNAGKKGISREEIHEVLVKKFPDKASESMMNTVKVQVPARINKEKFEVEKLENGKYRKA